MDAGFLLNRLGRMSPMEVLHRVGDMRAARQDRAACGTLRIDASLVGPGRLPVPPLDGNTLPLLIERADACCRHCIDLFALKGVSLGFPIRHEMDYKSGRTAPTGVFCGDIDYRDAAEIGDVKYIWEPARHLSLPLLALAWRATGREAYLRHLEEDLAEWIDANPWCEGIHWTSPLECGIRLINWTLAWQWAGDGFSESTREKLGASAALHLYHINRHYSRDSSANNHAIGEAAGLLAASLHLVHCPTGGAWRDKALGMLLRELDRQNHPDGVNREQSLAYQQFVLDFFLLAFGCCARSGVPVPADAFRQLDRMLRFLAACRTVTGEVMAYGDADDGQVVDLLQDTTGNLDSLLRTRRLLFAAGPASPDGAADLKSAFYRALYGDAAPLCAEPEDGGDEPVLSGHPDPSVRKAPALPSVLPASGGRKAPALASGQPAPVNGKAPALLPGLLYPAGGYAFLGRHFGEPDEEKLLFDFGSLGYLSLAAHGHADALSFIYAACGRLIFVDPGTYAYHADRRWRDWFRGTGAHNTVEIDGRSQSVMAGSFMWARKANCTLTGYEPRVRARAWHDGYAVGRDPVVHERTVAFEEADSLWSIRDRLACDGDHTVRTHFHLHPEARVEPVDGESWRIRRGGVTVLLRHDARMRAELLRGDALRPDGWYSPAYDVKVPAFSLCLTATIRGGTAFTHSFALEKREVCS